MFSIQSWVRTRILLRVCGVPLRIHSAGICDGSSSTSFRLAATIAFAISTPGSIRMNCCGYNDNHKSKGRAVPATLPRSGGHAALALTRSRQCRQGSESRSFLFPCEKILQPIAIHAQRRAPPRILQRGNDRRLRKRLHDLFAPVGQRGIAKPGQQPARGGIEISVRYVGIRFPFVPEVSPNVSPVFLEERQRAILRVTVEMDTKSVLFS